MSILHQNRSEIIAAINKAENFDLLIIGGGIHGAVLAKLAASSGYRVLLLEKNDYSAGTSSRSSKMAHGGLRYLELFDFQQVFEGIKARDRLFTDYPEIARPHKFFIPVAEYNYFFRIKLKLGLMLYDLMINNKALRHRWYNQSSARKELPELKAQKLMGCFCYYDGILNDSELVIENIMQARLQNACCLNYAAVSEIQSKPNFNQVTWHDSITNTRYEVAAKLVINCAGPWAGKFSEQFNARFSRGSHIIFSRPWNAPALFLPMPGKARYYFVWPHSAGTLVGTTEREVPVSEVELDPMPSPDELREIFDRLKKDLPTSGLTAEFAHYAFAGYRTLPLKGKNEVSAKLSRKHYWIEEGSLLSLVGGKLTTAEWTAGECLKIIARKIKASSNCNLPIDRISYGLPKDSIEAAFDVKQACYLEDYMKRRSYLEYFAGAGFSELENKKEVFEKYLGVDSFAKQREKYQSRIRRIQELLANA